MLSVFSKPNGSVRSGTASDSCLAGPGLPSARPRYSRTRQAEVNVSFSSHLCRIMALGFSRDHPGFPRVSGWVTQTRQEYSWVISLVGNSPDCTYLGDLTFSFSPALRE